jgi:MFS family permease
MAVYLPLAIGSVLFFALSLLMGCLGKRKEGEHYDFLAYFPYELYGSSRGPYYLSARAMEVLSLLCPIAAMGYFVSGVYPEGWTAMSFPLGLAVMGLASLLSILFLTLIPASLPRQHTALFFLADAASLLTLAMGGFFSLNGYIAGDSSSRTLSLVFSIALFVLALFDLLLLLNPRLSRWAEMKVVSQNDGSTKLERPRPFVLAFSEWLSLSVYAVGSVLLVIGLTVL